MVDSMVYNMLLSLRDYRIKDKKPMFLLQVKELAENNKLPKNLVVKDIVFQSQIDK